MRQTLTLARIDQIRAISDPLRLRLLDALIADELTIKRLADAVRQPASRLYYHIDLLCAADLVEIVGQIRRRGGVERVYRAVAKNFRMDKTALRATTGPVAPVATLLELTRAVLGGALESITEELHAGRIRPGNAMGLLLEERAPRLSPAGWAALKKELPAWLDTFAQRHGSPRGLPCQLVFAAFPIPAFKARKRR